MADAEEQFAGEPSVRVGSLRLHKGYAPGNVWIGQEGGEGGDFPVEDIEALLQAYYKEHF